MLNIFQNIKTVTTGDILENNSIRLGYCIFELLPKLPLLSYKREFKKYPCAFATTR